MRVKQVLGMFLGWAYEEKRWNWVHFMTGYMGWMCGFPCFCLLLEDECDPWLKTDFCGGSKGPYKSTVVGKRLANNSQTRSLNGRRPSDCRLTARIHQDSHKPKIKEDEADEIAKLLQMNNVAKSVPANNAAKTVPKRKVKISPSFTSRQGNHLSKNINPMKRIYTKWEEQTMRDQVINFKVKVSYADQPHGSHKNKCRCHAN